MAVRLEPEATLAGVVVDKEGAPVANAGVIPGEAPQSEAPENAVVAHTGSDGGFRLTGLTPDMTLVTVYHPDYAIVSAPVTLHAGQESSINVVLTQGGVIEGAVYLDNQPWPEQTVRLDAGRAENMFGVTAKTSESGAYRFDKVRIGSARLTLFVPASTEAGARDHRVRCKVVDVPGDKTTTTDFHFSSCTARMEGGRLPQRRSCFQRRCRSGAGGFVARRHGAVQRQARSRRQLPVSLHCGRRSAVESLDAAA